MITLDCTNPPPTTGGMYIYAVPGLSESDGSQGLSPCWVFQHSGKLHFMDMGDRGGEPRCPCEGNYWSERLTAERARDEFYRQPMAAQETP
jgi:hypothetical protein